MISASRVPNEFMCPITTEIMEDPVTLADGRSYEHTAIERWLQSSKRSPMTGQELPHTNMVPNVNLKALIEDWRDSQVVMAAIQEEETCLQELSRGEFAALRAQLQGAFQQGDGLALVVEGIQKIYNDEARRRFAHKRQELEALRQHCPVVLKYHGTTHAAAAAIARGGFALPEADGAGDFVGRGLRVFYTAEQRHAAEERRGDLLMFGQAVYVSSDLEKATRFADGALLLCQCALGNVQQAQAASHNLTQGKLLLDGFDSVQALPGCQERGGCTYEEFALYSPDQILATHIVHFRLVRHGERALVAQQVSNDNRTEAGSRTLREVLSDLALDDSAAGQAIDERRSSACKWLGDAARDDQRRASAAFLSSRQLVSQLTGCARSSNEALQFEALRAWWNFSFGDEANQALAMQQLGARFLASLLDSPNASLRLRAVGLVWNVTQHCAAHRELFAEVGVLRRLGDTLRRACSFAEMAPPWGTLQVALGALANLAMTCSEALARETAILAAAQQLMEEGFAPGAVQQQATRLVCNVISRGRVDAEWQANSYCYRTSAPRDLYLPGAQSSSL